MPFYSIIATDKPNEEGKATGSFMVIEAPDLATATALYEQDPFIKQGVFDSYKISRWALTINKSAGR
jgi:uncharacterized protein YciI